MRRSRWVFAHSRRFVVLARRWGQRLDEVLGVVAAAVLMSHLPPAGWSDVVT